MFIKIDDNVKIQDNRFKKELRGKVTGLKKKNKCEVYIQEEPFIIDMDNLIKTN